MPLKSEALLLACYGMYVPVPAANEACTLTHFLLQVLGLSPSYIEQRVQTILLNGFAVDLPERALLREGSRLALSAAMPGVVGAIMRRCGHYAPMRKGITLPEFSDPALVDTQGFWVELRCFNSIAADQGLALLRLGVAAQAQHLGPELQDLAQSLPPHLPPLPREDLVWLHTNDSHE